jgi:hypothetical protein
VWDETGEEWLGLVLTTRAVHALVFVLVTLSIMAGPAMALRLAQAQAMIIPPSPYKVYTSQTYELMIGVQYNFPSSGLTPTPTPTTMQWALWIESPPYRTDTMTVSGSGETEFSLVLTAPATAGVYTLTLYLYGQTRGTSASIMDTASVTYQVVQPIVTDWDVGKVWIDPAAPGQGDTVTFHTTIVLVSTNSQKSLTVQVACLLDGRPYYLGSLTFTPQPSSQDVTVPQTWTATTGDHQLTCAVDPNHQHNDPTPYPNYDYKTIKFTVQPYYAIIQSITTSPSAEIKEGDTFNVVVTVAYHFPGMATLKVSHRNNQTSPPFEERTDNAQLTGSGTKDFTFKTTAPFTTPTNLTCTQKYMLWGQGSVMFNRGAGWEKTDPGWTAYYNVTIKRPTYYALFDQVIAKYAGSSNATDHVTITLVVRYLLPIQSGLRITITRFDNASKGGQLAYGWTIVVDDESWFTQPDSVEHSGVTYVYTYSYPPSSLGSDKLTFIASIDYLACGTWNHGDQATVSATVPYTPPPQSPYDYLVAAVQKIINWFKSLLGGLLLRRIVDEGHGMMLWESGIRN